MKRKMLLSLVCGMALLAMTACKGKSADLQQSEDSVELSGAGATFPLPFYNVVFEQFKEQHHHTVAYGGIGSGGGVRNLKDCTVDFAGSDAFLSDKDMEMMDPVVHVPTCMGAIVLAYNLEGVDSLNLSGDVVADIYAGVIRKWDDRRIQSLNPAVKLPSEEIIPVFRSDGSGSTFVFTDYLCKVSGSWRDKYGCDKTVSFPVGQAAKGNPGVAGVISQTRNAIGYVGSEYAFAQNIAYASLKNANGEMVRPTAESISAAASGEIPSDTRTSITNSQAPGAYPISCFTWMVIYKEQHYADRHLAEAKATLELLRYILSDEAQALTKEVHYAPLPKAAVRLSLDNLKTVTYDGKPIAESDGASGK